MQRRRRFVPIALTAVVVAVVSTGCTKSDDTAASPTTTSVVTETTTARAKSTSPTSTDESQADPFTVSALSVAVDRYWDTFLAANNPPNPNHSSIAENTTGDAQQRMIENIERRLAANQAVRLPAESQFEHRFITFRFDGDNAYVTDCLVDDSQLVDLSTGEILDDELGTADFILNLRLVESRWKVSYGRVQESYPGRSGCASSW